MTLCINGVAGRTLDFHLDLSKTTVIGLKFLNSESAKNSMTEKPAAASAGSSTVSLSRKPSNNQDIDSLWRRPQLSQVVTQFETRFDDIRILFQMDVLHDQ